VTWVKRTTRRLRERAIAGRLERLHREMFRVYDSRHGMPSVCIAVRWHMGIDPGVDPSAYLPQFLRVEVCISPAGIQILTIWHGRDTHYANPVTNSATLRLLDSTSYKIPQPLAAQKASLHSYPPFRVISS
jgi:hypothetical protein